MSAYPDASNEEVKARLIHGSDKVDALKDISVSDGRVNFAASLENDTVAPGAPNDFGARNITSRGAELKWTAVGDDKWANGAAQGVELYMNSSPVTEDNLSEATTLGLPGSAEVGDLATYQLGMTPSENEQVLHFGMKSMDNVGNKSELRTTSVTIPASVVALKDNFDASDFQFAPTGDFQQQGVEGRGQVFTTASASTTSKSSSLTSSTIDLSGKTGAFLKFDSETSMTWGDRAKVEVSRDGGETWKMEMRMDRVQDWTEQALDLSDYDGDSMQVRFDFATRPGRKTGGFAVDNVVLLTDKA